MSQVRTQTASCTQVSASPQHTPHPPGARGLAAQREPAGIFPAGTWGQDLGLCVLSSCPSCVSALRGMAKTHDLIYLLCLESHGDRREGGPTWSIMTHSLVIGLAVWRFYVCDWRHLGQVFLVGPQSRVQTTWSRKMPVWHPHRWWWTWWTWRGDALWLCRSLGVTHISHRWVGRSSVIWERTLGNLLCLPFRASAAQMHTHTHTHAHMCTHTYTHVHAQTHTHLYTKEPYASNSPLVHFYMNDSPSTTLACCLFIK